MTRLPAAIKLNIAKRVNEVRSSDGPVNELVRALMLQHNVSRASIFRWADGQHVTVNKRRPLTRDQLIAVAGHHGNLHAAHAVLTAGGLDISYSQFCRRLANTDTDFAAAVTEGMDAMIQASRYNVQDGQYERSSVFGFDHTEVPVWVKNPGEKKKKIWISIALDWDTGFIFEPVYTEGDGSLRGDPNTTSIVSLVASIMVGQDWGEHRVGGIPASWVFDNALAHFSESVLNGLSALGVKAHGIRIGSPWENGPTENAVNVMEKQIWAKLPGYTHHLDLRYHKELWDEDELLSSEEVIAYTTVGLERINGSLPMKRHDGKTRLEAWLADKSMVRYASVQDVHDFFTVSPRPGYKIHKSGIHFRNIWYTSPGLTGNVGRTVEVRFLPTDPRFIDVYLNGEILCTAEPAKNLDPTARKALAKQRRTRMAKAERIQKASKAHAAEIADREHAEAILNRENDVELHDSDAHWNEWEVDEVTKSILELGAGIDGAFDLTDLDAEDQT